MGSRRPIEGPGQDVPRRLVQPYPVRHSRQLRSTPRKSKIDIGQTALVWVCRHGQVSALTIFMLPHLAPGRGIGHGQRCRGGQLTEADYRRRGGVSPATRLSALTSRPCVSLQPQPDHCHCAMSVPSQRLTSRQWPLVACAVQRRRFPVGASPRPATASAGSNRSSHGGNEVAEAFRLGALGWRRGS